MDLEQQLVGVEEQFWTGGPEHYRKNLTQDALMAFPDPAGLMGRDSAIEGIAQAPRWEKVEIEDVHVLRLASDAAILVYKGRAWRGDGEGSYSAVVSSTYVQRGGSWKLHFHQQTPAGAQ